MNRPLLAARAGSALAALPVALVLGLAALRAGEAQPPSTLERTIVGGSGGWDYLTMDGARHRLFITRGDRVQRFDTATMRVIAEIPGTDGVHGVALAPDLHIGFTSDGRSNSVTLFELDSLRRTARIDHVGDGPDAIVYDKSSGQGFTFNGRSRNATAIDLRAARVVATIALPGRPEFAVTDEAGSLFVNIEDRNTIARIDVASLSVTAQWPLPGCEVPTGLAIDASKRRLFASCGNRTLMVVDADSGAIVARLPIGAGSDAVLFDAAKSLVLWSNREGTLSILREDDADHYVAEPGAATRPGARTLALDPLAQRVHLVTADFAAWSSSAPASGTPRPVPIPGTFSVLTLDLAGYPDR
jgi:DNA-binding beta-propeller fold protein YncE